MCTAISFTNGDNYFGRNLDLDVDYKTNVVITPRDYPIKFTNGDIAEKHYAIIGSGIVKDNYPLYFEATNEKGVSCAGLHFPKYAEYAKGQGKGFLSSFEFINFSLGLCDSAALVRQKLKKIQISNTPFSSDFPPTPLHFIVSDKSSSFVFEQTKKGMNIYENKMGVLTNAPEFPMHKMYLNNFAAISSKPIENNLSKHLKLDNYSLGLGAFSLPGDFSSMSRFVRAVFVKENSIVQNSEENVPHFFRILESVSVPSGAVRLKIGGIHKTIYSSCCNTNKGIYYLKYYNSLEIKRVDMREYNLNSKDLIII